MSNTKVLKISEPYGIPFSGTIEDDYPIHISQKMKEFEKDYNAMIDGVKTWTEYAVEGTYGIVSGGVQYIDEILIPTIFDMFQDIGFIKNIRSPQVELLRSKINKITEEAENILYRDNILLEISNEIINDIEGKLQELNKKCELNIYMSTDKEVPDWEEFVISILIDEEDFDKIIEIWDVVEEEAEKRISEIKQAKRSEISHIESIDENLVIRVDSLENV